MSRPVVANVTHSAVQSSVFNGLLVSWQRAWRQQLVPLQHRRGFTTPYLSFEVFGVSVARVIPLSRNPAIVYALATLLFVALLPPFIAAPFAAGKATS